MWWYSRSSKSVKSMLLQDLKEKRKKLFYVASEGMEVRGEASGSATGNSALSKNVALKPAESRRQISIFVFVFCQHSLLTKPNRSQKLRRPGRYSILAKSRIAKGIAVLWHKLRLMKRQVHIIIFKT